jgi:predicted RNase H-like nuclease (RuvC/YqgF family)
LADKEKKEPDTMEEELNRLKAKVSQLEEMVAQKNREIARLEKAIADRDSEINNLKQSLAESNEQKKQLSDSLAQAVDSYKALVISTHPELPAELISGDTIEAVDQSLVKAKELVGKVKQGLEAEAMQARFPSGAPARTAPDLSSLSPKEKIQYAMGGFSS